MDRRTFVQAVGTGMVGAVIPLDGAAVAATPDVVRPRTASWPLTVDAVPGPLTMDSARTAVLVIDMQNDFGSTGGAFDRAGIDIAPIRAAVAPTRRVLAAARDAGIPVIYLKMGFKPDLSDAGAPDSPNYSRHVRLGVGKEVRAPGGEASRPFVRDTWNTEIIAELAAGPRDLVLWKHRFSGFFETQLDATLRRLGVQYLVVTGCTTSICVESTIRDAMFRDYSCVLLADCTGEPIGHEFARSNHDASLLSIQVLLGWTSTADRFVAAAAARPA